MITFKEAFEVLVSITGNDNNLTDEDLKLIELLIATIKVCNESGIDIDGFGNILKLITKEIKHD